MIEYISTIIIACGTILTIATGYVLKKRNADLTQFQAVIKKLETHIENLEHRIVKLEAVNNELNEKYQVQLVINSRLETEIKYKNEEIKELKDIIKGK